MKIFKNTEQKEDVYYYRNTLNEPVFFDKNMLL